MKKGKYRVVFVCSHPVQYMAQLFRRMALPLVNGRNAEALP